MSPRLSNAQKEALRWLYTGGGSRNRFEPGYPETMVMYRLARLGYVTVAGSHSGVFTLDPAARFVLTEKGHAHMARYNAQRIKMGLPPVAA